MRFFSNRHARPILTKEDIAARKHLDQIIKSNASEGYTKDVPELPTEEQCKSDLDKIKEGE